MITADVDSLFQQVLLKNDLTNLAQFHKKGLVDEIPLYGRESDIDFLSATSKEARNRLLLKFAFEFLESVIAFKVHDKPFLAAITVWNYPEDETIVPNIFICGRTLKPHELSVHEAKTSFSKGIKKLLSPSLRKVSSIFEDTSTAADMERVLIGPSKSPYESFLLLKSFANGVKA